MLELPALGGVDRSVRRRSGEGGRAGGTLLAGEFLALHQVEQRHHRGRHARVGRGVGGLEDNTQQRIDAACIGLEGCRRGDSLGLDLLAQGRQPLQRLQHLGDARQQPHAAIDRGRVAPRVEVALAHGRFSLAAVGDAAFALGGKAAPA